MLILSRLLSRLPHRATHSYARLRGHVHALLWVLGAVMATLPVCAQAAPVQIVCLGDSLTAGYKLPADAAFPVVLQKALQAGGFLTQVSNAGVSGDTASGGQARLDWSVAEGTDIVILELGANDMLRAIDPAVTRAALDTMLARLKARNIRVLLAGMRATPDLGAQYTASFDAIYPDLAQKYQIPLYPFFLDGVSGQRGLTLPDGLHPNRAGVEEMVARILPSVVALLKAPKA